MFGQDLAQLPGSFLVGALGQADEEMAAAGSKALGNQRFRLQNIEFLGEEFDPESKVGYKMQTKGYLIRQPNRERIDITAMEWTGSSCR